MATATFDLVDQPWLPVVWCDGERETEGGSGAARDAVGLAAALRKAHRIRRVVGETPPQTAALHRLLLAFAHRVYGGPGENEEWEALWSAPELPGKPLEDYVSRFRDRFDLLHAEYPFMQCPELASCIPGSVAQLVPYRAAGNNTTLFDHTTVTDQLVLDPATAARWLVTVHAYDTGGTKTPHGKGKEKSSETGVMNRFGCALVEGSHLKETLLLNLVLYDPASEKPHLTTAEDRPVWELPEPPGATPEVRPSRGWTDLLTWPGRRVLLSRREEQGSTLVEGVTLTPGTRLRAELPDVELMAAFGRERRAGTRKREVGPLRPVTLERGRGVWRHSQELLLAGDADRRRPHALTQLVRMVDDGLIPEDAVYTLRVFGQQLHRQGGAVVDWHEECVPAPVALLRAESSRIGVIIGHAVGLADGVGSALNAMERDYRTEFKGKPVTDLQIGYWPRLPEPFAELLRGLAETLRAGRSEEPKTEKWADTVTRIGRDTASRWAATPRDGRQTNAAGRYLGRFEGQLNYLVKRFQAHVAGFSQFDKEIA